MLLTMQVNYKRLRSVFRYHLRTCNILILQHRQQLLTEIYRLSFEFKVHRNSLQSTVSAPQSHCYSQSIQKVLERWITLSRKVKTQCTVLQHIERHTYMKQTVEPCTSSQGAKIMRQSHDQRPYRYRALMRSDVKVRQSTQAYQVSLRLHLLTNI